MKRDGGFRGDAEPFDVKSVTIPERRDRRRTLRRILRPRWLYMLSHRLDPVSPLVGIDRGTPIDRIFIEAFLEHHRALIRGAVLEVKDRSYTERFGQGVTTSAILDANRENKSADIYDDIRSLASIPDDAYDCFIVTQVLQYVDDLHASARSIHRVLKPGGTAFVTVPTVSKLDGTEDNVEGHYWRFTADSARYVFGKHFADLEIVPWGNVRLAMSFLAALCAQDLTPKEVSHFDARYTCGVLIRATKSR